MSVANETKIKFVNAVSAFNAHCKDCRWCSMYLDYGEEDLCDKGKQIIQHHLAYADTQVYVPL